MYRTTASAAVAAALLGLAAPAAHAAKPLSCGSELAQQLTKQLRDTAITLVESLPAGANANPVGTIALPICRIAGTVTGGSTPHAESQIKFEVWLPTAQWNGKFQGVGNGGLAGSIGYGAMRTALTTGYATASTDTGHVSGDTAWFRNDQAVIDNGYRGIHEMTVKAKAIIEAFYADRPKYSYFNGCSTGGGQGFAEAQLYPHDYDGILAGAPNYRPTRLRSGAHVWSWVTTRPQPIGTTPQNILPASVLPTIGNAVLAACDTLDGVKDNVIEDPRRCTFDPAGIPSLSAAQVEALRKLYAGSKDPATGQEIFPGYARGAEFGWNGLFGGANPFGAANDFLRNTLFWDPITLGLTYDFRSFDFHADVQRYDQLYGDILNAESVFLHPFAEQGKLLVYHGWSDPLIPTYNTLEYWSRLVDYHGGKKGEAEGFEKVDEFARLFLVPGMGHCSGGQNRPTDTFDGMGALERWVEQGIAPEVIAASHLTAGVVDKTRPLCLYPRVAVFVGSDGTNPAQTNNAANFECRLP
jgi:feruloyl esterase